LQRRELGFFAQEFGSDLIDGNIIFDICPIGLFGMATG
jgi:hypothetical protein